MTIKIAHGINYTVIENVAKILEYADHVRIIPPYEEYLRLTNINSITREYSRKEYIDITRDFIKEAQLLISVHLEV